jgi:CcmD family protein
MRRVLLLLSVLAALGGIGAPSGSAQGPDTPVSSDAAAPSAAQQPGQATTQPGYMGGVERAGTPAQAGQPPRTLRAYWHVFIAFAVTWLLLFGYAISLGRRWAALERQVLQGSGGAR